MSTSNPTQNAVHVSAVICTRNRPDKIGTAVASVLANDYPVLRPHRHRPEHHRCDTRCRPDCRRRSAACATSTCDEPGLSRAYNTRHPAARPAMIIAFTDDDCIVPTDWIHTSRTRSRPSPTATSSTARWFPPERRRRTPVDPVAARSPKPDSAEPQGRVPGLRHGRQLRRPPPAVHAIGPFDEILGGGGPLRSSQDYDLAYRTYRSGGVILLRPEVDAASRRPARSRGLAGAAAGLRHRRRRVLHQARALPRPVRVVAADGQLADAVRHVCSCRGCCAAGPTVASTRGACSSAYARQLQVRRRSPHAAVPREIERRPMTGQITILGAGPTGLGTAYRLAEMGHDRLGHLRARPTTSAGWRRAITDEHGFIWDHGGHVMFSHYTYFDDLVEKMLRGDYDQHMREAGSGCTGGSCRTRSRTTSTACRTTSFLDCVMGIIEAQTTTLPRENFAQWINADLRRRHRPALHAPLQLQGVGPPARDDGDPVAGRPGARRRRATDPGEPARRPRRRVVGAEQHVQVPAARHRDAVRPDGGSAAEAGQPRARGASTSTSRPRR